MLSELPKLIALAVPMVAFGYIASNTRQLDFWKMALIAFLAISFFNAFENSKLLLGTVGFSFLLGYALPYARGLEGFSDALSNLINSVRYRDAYEEIKRKEEEVENLRRMYERQRSQSNYEQERARQERRRQSENFRQQNQKQSSSGNDKKSQSSGSSSSSKPKGSTANPTKRKHLQTLGLDPDKEYSFAEIKKAYRRMGSKWHPDKFATKADTVIDEAKERFQEIGGAFEWLSMTRN